MGGSNCYKTSRDREIRFSKSITNRIRYNNNIKLHITSGAGYPIHLNINPNLPFNEVKKKYCNLIGKTNINKLVFIYRGKVLGENDSLNSMGIDDEITIVAFDGNDY